VRIETTKKIFESLFKDLDIEILSYNVLPRNKLNEHFEWVEDSPAIFVGVKLKGDKRETNNMSDTLTNLTGFEYNVFTE